MPPENTTNRASAHTYGPVFAKISKFALALPGVEARSSYGTPGLYVGKKFMARLRNDDLDTLVLKPVYDDEQRFLMETQPNVFFLTPHYVGYPTIVIRLSKVDPKQLEELVEQSWRRLATAKLLAELDGGPPPSRRGDRRITCRGEPRLRTASVATPITTSRQARTR